MIIAAVILFLVAFTISLVGVGLARRYALRLGLMDDPGHRKVHTVATPRNGGIGIFWGFALPLIVGLIAIHFLQSHITLHLHASFYFTGEPQIGRASCRESV